ncbi:MAG: radical SAM protein [Defluviitoga tunisiensis]|nr:radical SAM protein [Defluviitoga tunisiensis]
MNVINLSRPISAFWEVSNSCNLHCTHCYTSSAPKSYLNLNFKEATHFVDIFYKAGIYSVALGGGEPLALPYIENLIRYMTEKGMNVSLSTNGLLLTENKLRILKNAGLKIIQVSIDGLEESHEQLRGKGTYTKVLNTLKILKNVDMPFRVGTVINTYNYLEIETFITVMKANGVSVINFFRYMPSNGRHDLEINSSQLKITAEKLIKLEKLNVYGKNNRFYITFEPLLFFSFLFDSTYLKNAACTAGTTKFVIDPNGEVFLCNYIRKKVGDLKENGNEMLWQNIQKERLMILQYPTECNICKFKEVCRGGCKGLSYINGKNYITRDPACYINEIKEEH